MAIYRKYAELAGDSDVLDYGPGHIVWADENWDLIQWCIDTADEYKSDLTEDQHAIAIQALRELLTVPESVLMCEPEDYDGEHPEMFPPPANLVMRHK